MTEIVSREEWLTARKALLVEEKQLTRWRDEVSAKRRELPWVRVDKAYLFQAESGERSLSDLFDDKGQLLIYHFMFDPDWETGCRSCAFWADNFDGIEAHLRARDTSFKVVSNASLAKLLPYKESNGWTFDWVSAEGTTFGSDFGVSFNKETFAGGYNYSDKVPAGEMPGVSVFTRLEDGTVCHSYSTYSRGIDILNGAYHYIDLTPKGRNENFPMDWLKRRDEY